MSPDETTIAIAKSLENNTHLTELDLSGNSISTAGATALADVIKNPNCPIQKLNLSVNKVRYCLRENSC
jgi:Ran GTPase-activating protein (RanGAP) involved in mRNA processing and transport